ncbi:lipopolysaccharide assembly protein LapB [Allomuricauda sp. SCSIO 65647]|uniref:tetratricopeptide repeat protein n=1 Tax=Allomuricauda sp. SCSIO 65647 TaxID=2908843 RepID=UPI001F37B9FF|nr:hypothetical protein [Muricauda sp. SCSIO 65647]UJH69004.1 hypothetical protein L0P89_07255 [Muricauda sp. SCSIO 65647]
MKKSVHFFTVLIVLLIAQETVFAQEDEQIKVEQSAEVFLEEYTDEFQENFFEALKQKGIQNYDRAANLLLKCKQLLTDATAVDHELAKVYLLDKNYPSAQQYAIEALVSEPENYWFLHTLVQVQDGQGSTIEMVKDRFPHENLGLQQNLALIYFRQKRYQDALNVLKAMKKSDFTETLMLKINDSLGSSKTAKAKPKIQEEEVVDDGADSYKQQIKAAIAKEDHKALESLTKEALEAYPLQPYFYYANGLSLNEQGRHDEAVMILGQGLDYLFDDPALRNKIYGELSVAHKALGNNSKANEYLSKIKSGS